MSGTGMLVRARAHAGRTWLGLRLRRRAVGKIEVRVGGENCFRREIRGDKRQRDQHMTATKLLQLLRRVALAVK